MYVCNVGIMFVCSSDQGRTVIPTVKSFIKLINQINKSNQIKSYSYLTHSFIQQLRGGHVNAIFNSHICLLLTFSVTGSSFIISVM